MLLWQEYVAAHPEGRTWRYTQFCERYKAFARTLKRSAEGTCAQRNQPSESSAFVGRTLRLDPASRDLFVGSQHVRHLCCGHRVGCTGQRQWRFHANYAAWSSRRFGKRPGCAYPSIALATSTARVVAELMTEFVAQIARTNPQA